MHNWRLGFISVGVRDSKSNSMFESVFASTASYEEISQVVNEHEEIMMDAPAPAPQQSPQQQEKDAPPSPVAPQAPHSQPPIDSKLPRVIAVEYQDWTVEDVVSWFSYMRDEELRKMDTHYANGIKEHNIDGKALSTMNDEELVTSIGIHVDYHRRKFLTELAKVKKNKSMFTAKKKIHVVFFIVFSCVNSC